jgi:Transglycosylase SLT domain
MAKVGRSTGSPPGQFHRVRLFSVQPSEDQPKPARSLGRSLMENLMMMNALLISTAAYAVSTLLCVASVRAEDEEAAAFPSLPLPPTIVELIGLKDAKGQDASVSMVRLLEPEPQALMPEVGAVRAQDLVARLPMADEPLSVAAPFPLLPLPPEVGDFIGLRQTYPNGRNAHLALIRREAERYRVPPELADAVAQIESAYNPQASGALGEVGLMQIRPETAALLGYRGTVSGLFEPERNVYYSVAYLAGAWRRANGDLCRALMKYRAGHGEERMSAFSVEYCRRARSYLASTGSPLGEALLPPISAQARTPVTVASNARQVAAAAISALSTPLPPRRLEPEKTRIASTGQVRVAAAQNSHLDKRASAASLNESVRLPQGRLIAARNGRQVASATISASSAPIPPRRPESEKMRIASAGHVRLATAQRASARVAQPVVRQLKGRSLPRETVGRFVAAAVPAIGVPLPPPRPEAGRTRLASAGQVALTSAQKKQTDPRACASPGCAGSAPPARRSPAR